MDIPDTEDSFEKPVISEELVKKTVTHERFRCEECGERLDTKKCLTNHMISEHKQPGEVLNVMIVTFQLQEKRALRFTSPRSMV